MNDEEYIKSRLDHQITWYDKKSIKNKKNYIILVLFQVITSTSIPFIIIFNDLNTFTIKVIISAIGLLIAICTGILTLCNFQENWVEYRTTCESLKHHKYRYLTKTAPYEDEDAFKIFVNNIEALISKENTNWAEYIRAKDKSDIDKK